MNEEIKTLFDALSVKVEEMKSTALKASDLEAINQDLAILKGLEAKIGEEQKKQFEALKEDINVLKDTLNIGGQSGETLFSMVDKWVKENHATLKENFTNGKGTISLEGIEKAVGIVTTANGTLLTALPANFVAESQGVPNVALRRPNLLDYVRTYSTNKVTLAYIEAVPGEGDFSIVAEGGTKPQLDLDWVTRYATPQKYAGWIKVTEEAIDDIPYLRDMIVNYLRAKHDLFKERQVFAAINTNAVAFVTGGGLSGAVAMPNIMDVVNALQLQIINSPNYTDEPDFFGDVVLLNVVDFYRYFGAAKDALGRPLYSDGFQAGKTFTQNGFTFVATTLVDAGEVILYDSTKIDVTTYKPYAVSIGWVNDDFIKNQFVILGESRGHIFIKNHDKRAFVKGSITDIITDIEMPDAPETP